MPPDPKRSEAARKAWRTRRAKEAGTYIAPEKRSGEPARRFPALEARDSTPRGDTQTSDVAGVFVGLIGLVSIGWLVHQIWTCQIWVGVVFVGLLTLLSAAATLPAAGLGGIVGFIMGMALWDAWCN